MNDSDEALLRLYADGDDRAFARLLERYRAPVAHLVASSLGSGLWTEDVVQDVFVQVHRSARTFEGRSSFKTWLYGIALNLCSDQRRRQRARPADRALDAADDDRLDTLPDLSLDPLQTLERDELRALVVAALERLGPGHRIVLQLRDGEDLSYEEIAHVLGVPVGTVRSRLHNARAALARELAVRMKR